MDLKLTFEHTKVLNVLYVEDDEVLRSATRELFSNYFKNVDIAVDGQEGLSKYLAHYDEHSEPYDLIITDINMPNLNGIDMSQEILKKEPMQAIVIISAHNEASFLFKAIELGISGFLSKPINHQRLSNVFYKTAQQINDHKFVEAHVGQIEVLNLQLEEQNRELLAKNSELEKSFRLLETMRHKKQLIYPETKKETLSVKEEDSASRAYVREQIQQLIHNDLHELKDILLEIDIMVIDIINRKNSFAVDVLPDLGALFSKYAFVLSYYTFFDDLSHAMSDFSRTLKEHPLPENAEHVQNIFMLLESFIYVLGKWQDDLSSGEEKKVNEFDASIISDMRTIKNMWMEQENECDSNDLNDIFDF